MKRFDGYMRGVDLGGWLSQGSYDKEHLDSFIVEDDIKKIAGWGLDHVRLPVDYNILETEEGEDYEEGLAYVQKAVDWCGKYGLNIVLDLHKTFGFSFYSGYGESGFFQSEELQERYYRLWERLAKRFGKYSDRICFELLNEVNDKELSDTWNKIIRTVIPRIRVFAPDIKIITGGYWNNSVDALYDLEKPYDENVVYTFHCYDPFLFTHQGGYWVDGMPEDLRVGYPGDINEYRVKIKEIGRDDIQDYMDIDRFDTSYFEGRFKGAIKLCEERGCALYCGEYGVIDRASPEDTLRWYSDIHAAFEKAGIGRAAWNYKQMDFGLTDDRLSAILPELTERL
ncbi:MAG: cellulase family glycosylhydrolase [Ruminococcus sp.]|nr:cellulase family glycosylhydrolase [Ruminococcus sp.]